MLAPGAKKPIPIEFATVFSDDAKPVIDPEESLRDDWQGFGSFSRIDRPHWAVFVLREAVEVPAGSRLRLVLDHGMSDPGEGALVIERGRYWVSSDPRWAEFTDAPSFKQSLDSIGSLRKSATRSPASRCR